MSTLKEKQFIDTFKSSLKIVPRTLSVKTLLSDRNLKRIDYKPYYQRNYVWDSVKQSFFIESVLLGTELPPLILYKSGGKIEVIDGRQRFETLKRFKDNEIALSPKGLMALPALQKNTFNKLKPELQDVFWEANIRVFEFEVITEISSDVEDKIKKEIFRRYNTGITPLTSYEVDTAKYDEDSLSRIIENDLKRDTSFYEGIKKCFFPKEEKSLDLINKITDYLRRIYILPKFPITRYAQGSGRSDIIALLYDTTVENIDSPLEEYKNLKDSIQDVINLHKLLSDSDAIFSKCKLMYECLLWVKMISEIEGKHISLCEFNTTIQNYYKTHIEIYSDDNAHFYRNIITRFNDTADCFDGLLGVNLNIYIKRIDFNAELKSIRQSDNEVLDVIKELDRLRINKPSPVSKPVEEILSDVVSNKYLVRPSYQRQEKVSVIKASAIIESILLGISLPPIFIFKRKDGVKEVIDGQQRLLSIIGFLGKQYRNEEDSLAYSKNNTYKLKKLNILTELNGLNYHAIPESHQDKILDFVIDEIIIDENLNPDFDPTDLFIRLNQKPYPIQQNSFEMWNSTVDRDVIEKIKQVAQSNISWFYSKESKSPEERTDRMENEELITLLSYISSVIEKSSYDKVLGTFKRNDRITCRIKDKNTISEYLIKLEDNQNEKDRFISFVEKTDTLIQYFGTLFNANLGKETLNEFFNVKNSATFRRSYQDFYIVWIVLNSIDIKEADKQVVKQDVIDILRLLRNADGYDVDDTYYEDFVTAIEKFTAKSQESNNLK